MRNPTLYYMPQNENMRYEPISLLSVNMEQSPSIYLFIFDQMEQSPY